MRKKAVYITCFITLIIISVILLAAATGNVLFVNTHTAKSYDPNNWNLILVNKNNSIPQNYKPELMELSNGIFIDSRIYPDLQKMFDAARSDGLDPIVGEGFRTKSEQQQMMTDKIQELTEQGYSRSEAEKLAKEWVAVPGTSEHELGLALDINSQSGDYEWEIYSWLAENAYKYGFILRYPEGKTDITGIEYEPWHYRYVGIEAATEIYRQEVTLEEYLDKK